MKADTELQRDVLGKLREEPNGDARHIAVAVDSGVVTLSGHVSSLNHKWTAEEIARRVPGVYAVVNELEVQLPGMEERDDSVIAGEALTILSLNTAVPADRIKVSVDHGWLTLEGSVERQSERVAAEETVRGVTGLRGITNLIQVREHSTAEEVKNKIDEALAREGEFDAKNIRVVVTDGRIILEGKVHSAEERKEAERAARAVPEVRVVENYIRIVP